MAVKLEGFVDDGKGSPLPNISAIVTRVADGAIVTSGLTGADGRWVFTGLSEGDEHFVNLADGAGNAIVRGPWSGELREAWVRDRLALPNTGHALLPAGANTTVGGLPLVLDPNPANGLAWGPSGLFSSSGGLTQAAADLRYEPIDTMYTKAEADARYPQKTDIDPYPNYLTPTEANALYMPIGAAVDAWTKAESNARFVDVTGDTMSGSLGIVNSTSTRISNIRAAGSLQRPGVDFERWKTTVGTVEEVTVGSTIGTFGYNASGADVLAYGGSIYAYVDAPIVGGTAPIAFSFYHATLGETYRLDSKGRGWFAPPDDTSLFPATPGLYISGKWVGISATAGNSLTWNADGFYVSAPAVTDLWVNTTGDTMTGNLTLTSPSRIIAPQVGHELGWIGTTAYTAAMPDTQASIFIYRSGANWAGMGADGLGNFWLRTGLAGTPVPSLVVQNDGTVITQRNTLITSWGINSLGDITLDTTRKIKFFDEVKDDKIVFYGTQFKFGIRAGELAYQVAPAVAKHNFYVNDVSKWLIADTVLTSSVAIAAPSMTIASKSVGVSATGGNALTWNSDGFFVTAGVVTDIWVDVLGDTMTGVLNMAANVLPTTTNTRDLGSTSLRWLKVWAQDADFTNAPTVGGTALLTATTADALFLTPAEGNAAYATAAHNHDATYVQLVGGSVMTGLLGPTTTNTRDLGTSALRWRNAYLATSLNIGTTPAATGVVRLANANLMAWRNAGNTGDLTLGVNAADALATSTHVVPTVTNTVDLGTTTLRWRKVWGVDADLSGALSVSGVLTLPASGAMIEIGLDGFVNSPGIDFHSSANVHDYDVRLAASGGAAGVGLGTLTITAANVALSTALTVNSRPVIMAGCRVRKAAAQTLTTGTPAAIAFDNERYDTDNFHDTVTNNTRCTVPAGLAGKYLITGCIEFAGNATGNRSVSLRVSGAIVDATIIPAVNTNTPALTVTAVWDMVVGDYAELWAFQDSGGNLNVNVSANYSPELSMHRIG